MQIGKEAGVEKLAVALYDYETELAWSYRGDSWFHAASTIKVAVLVSLFGAIKEGYLHPYSRVHVRNRFFSIVDNEPYRIPSYGDTDLEVYAAIGRTMMVKDLAYYMIASSSNLATNLLVEIVGLEKARQMIEDLQLTGIELKRGVEDNKAYAANINNRVTANGLLHLFRMLEEKRIYSAEACEQMLNILFQQRFSSGIPAGLPSDVRINARVAHKTGEISTIAHDAGLVYLPGRKPYAIVILTEWNQNSSDHQEAIARISQIVYEQLACSINVKEYSNE
jgi:beta-lactamase class A